MVLFLCRNKSSRNGMKLCEEYLPNKREFLEPRATRGLSPPSGPAHPETDAIKSYFSINKSGRKNYRDPRDGAAVTSCSSSGGQIWSLFGAPERGIRRRHHHQPSSITNFMMLTAVRE